MKCLLPKTFDAICVSLSKRLLPNVLLPYSKALCSKQKIQWVLNNHLLSSGSHSFVETKLEKCPLRGDTRGTLLWSACKNSCKHTVRKIALTLKGLCVWIRGKRGQDSTLDSDVMRATAPLTGYTHTETRALSQREGIEAVSPKIQSWKCIKLK